MSAQVELGRAPIGAERMHFRADGLTKIGWSSKSVAKRSARSSLSHGHAPVNVYRCLFCRLWHHGRWQP